MNFLDDLTRPGITIIVGSMGMGKTATAYRLAEHIHQTDLTRKIYAYVPDMEKVNNFICAVPSWVIPIFELDLEHLPRGALIVADEAALWANSKNFKRGEKAEALGWRLATTRQRSQTLIVIIQSLALLELDYFRMGARLVCKYTTPVSARFERAEIKELYEKINTSFLSRSHAFNIKSLAYCLTERDAYFVSFSLPTFWNETLSKVWGV